MKDPFKVSYLRSVKEEFKKAFRRLRDMGMETSFVKAAEIIDDGLQNDPRGFGDPTSFSSQLQMDIYVRAVIPL
jgi:hypothetical protein